MDLIADGLLVLAALVASLYCWVLSRRLRRLTQLDQGLGAAISSLSEQVEEMQTTLAQSKESIEVRTTLLANLTKEADQAIRRLDSAIKSASELKPAPAEAPVPDPAPMEEASVEEDLGFEETVLELNEDDPEPMPDLDDEPEDLAILRVDRPDAEVKEAPRKEEEEEIDADALASLINLTKSSDGSESGALDRLLKALKRDVQEPST
ncbi:MAG: hypothetical protein AAGH74_00245 [Pseudomonadota bacterium]